MVIIGYSGSGKSVAITHIAFQVMVGLGSLMAFASLWAAWCWIRRREVADSRLLLLLLTVLTPAGFIALEAGWVVTEVGRQPWIVPSTRALSLGVSAGTVRAQVAGGLNHPTTV